jgi:NAD(P)H-dependent flavin oxidoreductase YrpB (nitropropane dioxygenase family)
MAYKVSTGRLAAAVAEAGGIGTIAGTGLTAQELIREIERARELTSGYIGVNVLFAVEAFAELMLTAMREKVDFVASGAGFSRDMYSWGRDHGVPVVSIVSSARLAVIAQKLGAAAVVVEGKEAGGHLGTDRPVSEIVPEVVREVGIPVVAAGGIMDGYDIARMLRLGASGVQMATRFVTSHECEVHPKFKRMYLSARAEDVVLIKSPVGLPGRALRNAFTESIGGIDRGAITSCRRCLKRCSAEFCILDALRRSVAGDVEGGLVFSGEFVHKVKRAMSVEEIMSALARELREALDGPATAESKGR